MARAPARPRDLHRHGHRRAVRPGHRVRRRRHHDRADQRPRDGAAAAQPVPGAPPDRALARGARRCGEWRGASAGGPSRRWSRCCCASPRWCARCRSCARWTSTRIIVDEYGAVAVDARIVVDGTPQRQRHAGSYGHLAILPYPARYEQRLAAARRRHRTPCARSAPTMRRCCRTLVQRPVAAKAATSASCRRFDELPPSMLARFTLIDYDREMALVAVVRERTRGRRRHRDRDRAHRRRLALRHQPRPAAAASSRWWWPTTSAARAWARA